MMMGIKVSVASGVGYCPGKGWERTFCGHGKLIYLENLIMVVTQVSTHAKVY